MRADFNWLGDNLPRDGETMACYAKVRSTRPPRPALLRMAGDIAEIELLGGEEGVAPGQACVLYDGAEGNARVLGGGFIRRRSSQAHAGAVPGLQAAI